MRRLNLSYTQHLTIAPKDNKGRPKQGEEQR